jgi:hypothetical protein
VKVLGCNDEIVDELVEVIVGVEVVAKLRLTLEVVIKNVGYLREVIILYRVL